MSSPLDSVFAIAARHGVDTSQLVASYALGQAFLDKIRPALAEKFPHDSLPGVEILVIGSIAKRQCTEGSDLDFFGIVDEPLDKSVTDPIARMMFETAGSMGFELPFSAGITGVFVPRVEMEKLDVINDTTPKRFRRMTMTTASVSAYRPEMRLSLLRNVIGSFIGRERTPRVRGMIDYLVINARLGNLVAEWMKTYPPPDGGYINWVKAFTIYRLEYLSALAAIIRADRDTQGRSREELVDAIVTALDRTPLERLVTWYDEVEPASRDAIASMISISNDSLRLFATEGVRKHLAAAADDEPTRAIVQSFQSEMQRLAAAMTQLFYREPAFRPWTEQLGLFG